MPTRDHTPETHFVGDSHTAEQIEALAKDFDDRFDKLERRLEHMARHDRAFPTEGCEFCGVPSAA